MPLYLFWGPKYNYLYYFFGGGGYLIVRKVECTLKTLFYLFMPRYCTSSSDFVQDYGSSCYARYNSIHHSFQRAASPEIWVSGLEACRYILLS